MKHIKTIMDYMYIRMAKYFFKADGSSANRALILLSAFQGLIIIDLISAFVIFFFTREDTSGYTNIGKILAVAICIIIFYLNMLRYKDKYLHLRDKWVNEEKKVKQLRGVLIVLALIAPWLVLIIFGVR